MWLLGQVVKRFYLPFAHGTLPAIGPRERLPAAKPSLGVGPQRVFWGEALPSWGEGRRALVNGDDYGETRIVPSAPTETTRPPPLATAVKVFVVKLDGLNQDSASSLT